MITRALLLDIEGTTTPISFVHDVLFPYAREHFKTYLDQHSTEVADDLLRLRDEHEHDVRSGLRPPSLTEPYIYWLMDQDRKSPALKSLQGKIWEYGYDDGSLLATVFDDVPRAFERWHGNGPTVNIFSSGSVLAQKLLFKHTNAGDLTKYISHYFDTGVGKKTERASYERILEELQLSGAEVHFVSDIVAELDAAVAAGMKTSLCVRPGNQLQDATARHKVIGSLAEI
jgi:enolase-phosphatase E1